MNKQLLRASGADVLSSRRKLRKTLWAEVAVHENGISDIEKFNHLRSLVEGAAYAMLARLSLTEEN